MVPRNALGGPEGGQARFLIRGRIHLGTRRLHPAKAANHVIADQLRPAGQGRPRGPCGARGACGDDRRTSARRAGSDAQAGRTSGRASRHPRSKDRPPTVRGQRANPGRSFRRCEPVPALALVRAWAALRASAKQDDRHQARSSRSRSRCRPSGLRSPECSSRCRAAYGLRFSRPSKASRYRAARPKSPDEEAHGAR
jgi:hypothetical protein